MSDSKIKQALKYNKARGFTNSQVRMIQRVVGAASDGVWGPKTVAALIQWQAANGLAPDGMVGPRTWTVLVDSAKYAMLPEATDPPVLGIWADDRFRIKKPHYWDEMREHGITSVALMFEKHSPEFDPYYTYEDLEMLSNFASDRGMRVGVTDWPWPTQKWMADAEAYLRRIFDPKDLGLPIAFYESDVEGNWRPDKVRGYKNIDHAGDALVAMKARVVEGSNARKETTSFTSHVENGPAADVAPHMDAVFNQCYAVRRRRRRGASWEVPWDHTYGPGNMVRYTLDRSLQIPGVSEGKPRLGAGLAAYDQVWPGHTPHEAMMKSYNEALRYRVFEIRWWSFSWVFGRRATEYGRPFFKGLVEARKEGQACV